MNIDGPFLFFLVFLVFAVAFLIGLVTGINVGENGLRTEMLKSKAKKGVR